MEDTPVSKVPGFETHEIRGIVASVSRNASLFEQPDEVEDERLPEQPKNSSDVNTVGRDNVLRNFSDGSTDCAHMCCAADLVAESMFLQRRGMHEGVTWSYLHAMG